MYANYYPKYNIILINGNACIEHAFLCFLDSIYEFKLVDLSTDKIVADYSSFDILNTCLSDSFNFFIKQYKQIIKQKKIYCQVVFCFNINKLLATPLLFNYIDKQKSLKIINKYLKTTLRKEKMNGYILPPTAQINFIEKFIEILQPSGEVQEVLSIISSNLV